MRLSWPKFNRQERLATSSGVPLKPYLDSREEGWRARVRRFLPWVLALWCLFQGFFFALFAPYLVVLSIAPVAVLGALVIWALPDTRYSPAKYLEPLVFGLLISLIAWPDYLAVALPGLPWITMNRLFGIPLAGLFLVCVSASPDFRTRLAATLNAVPVVWKLLTLFVVIQFISIGFSRLPFDSIQKFVLAQIDWTVVFFAACYVFMKPGRVARWAAIVWALAVFVGLIGVAEVARGQVPWAGHIPGFLRIQDPTVALVLKGGARAALGVHRLQSTSTTPLGAAEFVALALPFILQFATGNYRLAVRLAAYASTAFLFWIVLLTQARLGMIGFILAVLLQVLFWALLRVRRQKSGLIARLVVYAYPVGFCLAIASTFFFHRIRAVVWGNGPQAASNEARQVQIQTGIPKILSHPWGHGIGMGGDTLNYIDLNGLLTIDSYYLSIALEYGVLGFAVYYGLFAYAAYISSRYTISHGNRSREYGFLGAIAIALVNFIVIKSVFSQEANHPLVFMILGMAVALLWRIQREAQGVAERGP
jgi:hypothetical protein